MAIVTIQAGMLEQFNWQNFFEAGDVSNIGTRTGTSMTYTVTIDSVDYAVTLAGTGFGYDDDIGAEDNPFYGSPVPNKGSINAISVVRDPSGDNALALTVTGLKYSLTNFVIHAFDFDDPFTGGHNNGNGWNTASSLFSGNDTFQVATGVTVEPQIQVGNNSGNDKVYGSSFDDYFEGSRGDDYYDGKGGHSDTLSYIWPSSEGRDGASRGVILDAIGKKVKPLGTATDIWGNHDTFRSIENFGGSMNADKMSGANQPSTGNAQYDEWFFGYAGNDTIDGRGGWDWISYQEDARFGGFRGINANLSVVDKNGFAKVYDGFGNLDKVKNVEAIMGTNFKDTMIGNNKDNGFQGLAGDDTIDGKGGNDWIMFWKNRGYIDNGYTPTGGQDGHVEVDLSVVNGGGYSTVMDGLGGTDLVRNVENVRGSDYDDLITGNALANKLLGQDGNDVLDGKQGHDYLEGGDGNDSFKFSVAPTSADSDEVDDFNNDTQSDRIVLSKAAFAALTTAQNSNALDGSEFHSASGGLATTTSEHIIYDPDNGNLWYDSNGSDPGGRVLIAHFNGAPNITAADFDIIA